MKEVELLLGFHKVNTTAYHPQTDGLVERFNRTLTAMLAKTAERGGRDWDHHLPYVLRVESQLARINSGITFLPPVWKRPEATKREDLESPEEPGVRGPEGVWGGVSFSDVRGLGAGSEVCW